MTTSRASSPAVAPSVPQKLSYDEFLRRTDAEVHAEWVDGEVVAMAPVSDEHADLHGFLLTLLRQWAEARDVGVVRSEPFQMKTGPDLPGRSPDIFFLANANLSRLQRTHLKGPADLVIEIVSADSAQRDRKDKFAEYEQGGVREYWIIDPERKQADFFVRSAEGRFGPAATDAGIYRSTVLETLWIKPDWLWQRPLPGTLSILRQWRLI